MSMNELLTIGKLASAASVNVETIRFYERKGILKQPKNRGPLDIILKTILLEFVL